MPRRPAVFRRIVQWIRRRRQVSSSEEGGQQRHLEERQQHQAERQAERPEQRQSQAEGSQDTQSQEAEGSEDIGSLEVEGSEGSRSQAEGPAYRGFRVLYSDWELEGPSPESGPMTYRLRLTETPERLRNIRRGLAMIIDEAGVIFRLDIVERINGEIGL